LRLRLRPSSLPPRLGNFYLGYDHDDLDLGYFGTKRAILHFFAPATTAATWLRLQGDVITSALFVSSLIVCAPPL
jgi:hypothetical protein